MPGRRPCKNGDTWPGQGSRTDHPGTPARRQSATCVGRDYVLAGLSQGAAM